MAGQHLTIPKWSVVLAAESLGCSSLSCVVFQETGTQTSAYLDASADTFSGSGAETVSTTGPGSECGGGLAVDVGRGDDDDVVGGFVRLQQRRERQLQWTMTTSSADSYAFSSVESDSYSEGLLGTWSSYQAGAYSGGCLSLGSVVFAERSTLTWSAGSTGSATESGSGIATTALSNANTGTMVRGGELDQSLGTINYNSVDQYAYNAAASWSDASNGTLTAGDSQAGVYAHGSYSISSVTYDDGASFAESDTLHVSDHEAGSGSSSYAGTGTSSSLGSLGSSSWGGTDSATFSGQDQYAYTDDTTDTQALTASGSWTRHEEGQWSHGNDLRQPLPPKGGGPTNRGGWPAATFSLGCVLYAEQGLESVSDDSAGTLVSSGSGSWSSVDQSTDTAGNTLAFASGSTGDATTDSQTGSYSFGETTVFTDNESAYGSYASYFAGQWSNGSYSFGSVTLDEAGGDSYSLDLSDVQQNGGSSLETVTGSSTALGTFADPQSSSNSTGSYSYSNVDAGTLASTDTLHVQSNGQDSYSWHGEGCCRSGRTACRRWWPATA